jgi:hypothetical protein
VTHTRQDITDSHDLLGVNDPIPSGGTKNTKGLTYLTCPRIARIRTIYGVVQHRRDWFGQCEIHLSYPGWNDVRAEGLPLHAFTQVKLR